MKFRMPWRSSNAAVCKTAIRECDSHRHLQKYKGTRFDASVMEFASRNRLTHTEVIALQALLDKRKAKL